MKDLLYARAISWTLMSSLDSREVDQIKNRSVTRGESLVPAEQDFTPTRSTSQAHTLCHVASSTLFLDSWGMWRQARLQDKEGRE